MLFESIRTFIGANLHHSGPALVLTFKTEPGESPESLSRSVLTTILSAMHRAGITVSGMRRLIEKSGSTASTCRIIIETDFEKAATHLLQCAFRHVQAEFHPGSALTDAEIYQAHLLCKESGLNDVALAVLREASHAKIPCIVLEKKGQIQIGFGCRRRRAHLTSQKELLDLYNEILVREPVDYRIPIISITGTNGKTTVTRVLSHVFSSTGMTVGMTSTEGVYVGQECLERGDLSGPKSARRVLRDSRVEIAVLETARGGILRAGLGYDFSDVAVVTNIQPDHLGQDGIETLDDLVKIKGVVAHRVRDGGALVLNADDPSLATFAEAGTSGRPRELILYSQDPRNPWLLRHLSSMQRGFTVQDGWIVERHGDEETLIVRVCDIPCSFNGSARFQVSNVMAASAAARAAGLDASRLASGIRTFHTHSQNRGRNNLFRVGAGFLLVDYAHNLEAIRAIGEMVRAWRIARPTCILGLPGDRKDSLLRETALVAAEYFPKLILREENDLRGRKPGEVPALVREAISSRFPGRTDRVIPSETDALRTALTEMSHGDLTVHCFDEWENVERVLRSFGAEPMNGIEQSGIPVAS